MSYSDAIALSRDCVLLVVLGVALYTDLTRGKVYNWCTIPAIVFGLCLAFVEGALPDGQGNALARIFGARFIDALLGLALALGVFGVAYLLHAIGGGDLKLMGAIGALMGWRFFIHAAIWTACAGAVVAVGVLIWRGRLREGMKSSLMALFTPRRFRQRREALPTDAPELITIPYVAAIAAGTLVAWLTAIPVRLP